MALVAPSPRLEELNPHSSLDDVKKKVEKASVIATSTATTTATSSIRSLINKYAAKYDVDANTALDIAVCESGKETPESIDPLAKNPRSTASGVFQFLKGSWRYYGMKHWGSLEGRSVFDAEDNIELALWVMSTERGTKDWIASHHCWGI